MAVSGGALLDCAVWGGVGLMGWLSGREAARAEAFRPDATAEDRWSVSRRPRWTAGAAFRFTAWPRVKGGRWTAPAVLSAVGERIRGEGSPAVGDGVWLSGSGRPPLIWEQGYGVVEGSPPGHAQAPGGFSTARFLGGRGLRWRAVLAKDPAAAKAAVDLPAWIGARALAPLRNWISSTLDAHFPRRESLLLRSVLLGDRDSGLAPQKESFARLGLAHLFAVSGLHVGILAAVILAAVRPFAKGPAASLAGPAIILPVYVLLTGAAGSTLRAAGLTILLLSGPVWGRRGNSLRSLGLLFWLSILWSPQVVDDTGFRLSYMAACGIVATQKLLGPDLKRLPVAPRWIASGLAVSCGAQWFTMPEVAASFGWIHPLSPLVNLVVVPTFSIAVWLAVCGLVSVPVPLLGWAGQGVLAWSWLILRVIEGGASWADARAGAPAGLVGWGPLRVSAFLLLSVVIVAGLGLPDIRRRTGRVLALAAAVGIVCLLPAGGWSSAGGMRVIQFAVDQGDCAAFFFPDGEVVVLDTGDRWRGGGSPWARTVAPWLAREGVRVCDAVVLTHGHADHTGGAADLAGRFAVGRWLLSGSAKAPPDSFSAAPRQSIHRGDIVHRAGEWSLVCLYPPAGAEFFENENDNSAVLALRRADRTVGIWSGDLEEDGEAVLLESGLLSGCEGIQVLKAGHHGSRTSGSAPFLDALRPRLIIVSCGVENRHSHPSHGPFVAAGDTVPVLRTDLEGAVRLEWDSGGRLKTRTMRVFRAGIGSEGESGSGAS